MQENFFTQLLAFVSTLTSTYPVVIYFLIALIIFLLYLIYAKKNSKVKDAVKTVLIELAAQAKEEGVTVEVLVDMFILKVRASVTAKPDKWDFIALFILDSALLRTRLLKTIQKLSEEISEEQNVPIDIIMN